MQDFSPENVAKAFAVFNLTDDPAIRSHANDFLMQWIDSPVFHRTCCSLLFSQRDPHIQLQAANVFKRVISTNWLRYPPEFRAETRAAFLPLIEQDIAPDLLSSICQVLAVIGFYDFPDDWRDFLDMVFSSSPDTDPFFTRKIQIFVYFVELLGDSDQLSSTKKYDHLVDLVINIERYVELLCALLARPDCAEIGITLCTRISATTSFRQLLTEDVYYALLSIAKKCPELSDGVFECLEVCMIQKSEVIHALSVYASVLFRVLADLPEYSEIAVRFITGFAGKYWRRLIWLMTHFGSELPGSSGYQRRESASPKRKRWQTTVTQAEYCADFVRVLHNLLKCCPTECNLDPYWTLWNEVVKIDIVPGRVPRVEEIGQVCEILESVMAELLPSLSRFAFTLVDKSSLVLPARNLVFGSMFTKDIEKTIGFFSANSEPELFYALGLASVDNPDFLAFVGRHLSLALQNLKEENCEALLFAAQRKWSLFTPDQIIGIAQLAATLLYHPAESMQISAAMFLTSVWAGRSRCFPADLVLPPNYLPSVTIGAIGPIVKLCGMVSRDEEAPIEPIINFLCDFSVASPLQGLEACVSFCQVSADFATALFHRLFRLLMASLDGGDDLPELALSFCATAISYVNVEACTDQIDALADFLVHQELTPLAVDFFATIRLSSKYFARYAPALEERLGEVPPCAPLFSLFEAAELFEFSPEFLAQKTVDGIRDPRGSVSAAALNYATLAFTGGMRDWYTRVVAIYRSTILRAIFESMFDRLHVNDFKKHTKFVWTAFRGCLEAGDDSITADLVGHIGALCELPAPAIEKFVERLWGVGPDLVAVREHLCDLLTNVRCAPPELAEKLLAPDDLDDQFDIGGYFTWGGFGESDADERPAVEDEWPLAGEILRLRAS
jgi:hypothetical protein